MCKEKLFYGQTESKARRGCNPYGQCDHKNAYFTPSLRIDFEDTLVCRTLDTDGNGFLDFKEIYLLNILFN